MRQKKRVGALLSVLAAMAGAVLGGGAGTALAADQVPNSVQRGQVVVVKYDAETKKSEPQGTAKLEGIKFTLTNKSDQAVVVLDDFGHKREYAKDESWDISVVKEGDRYIARTASNGLPYGKYNIRESSGTFGYALPTQDVFGPHPYLSTYLTDADKQWVTTGYDFTISEDGQVVTYDGDNPVQESGDGNYTAGPAAHNPVIRGGIQVQKRDHDFLANVSQGDSSLMGGTWLIYNKTGHDVIVWDHFDQGDGGQHGVVAEPKTYTSRRGTNKTWTTEIGENGVAHDGALVAVVQSGIGGTANTFMDALPVGVYQVVEAEAPVGYANAEKWSSYVTITNDNWDSLTVTDCDDPVLRGALKVTKHDSDLGEGNGPQGTASLAGAEFTIYNATNQDMYIFGSDDSRYEGGTGDVSGTSGVVHPGGIVGVVRTDASGVATLKGLPYGTYKVKETKAPEGYILNEDYEETVVMHDESKMDAVGLTVAATAASCAENIDRPGSLTITKTDAETGKDVSQVTGKKFVDLFVRVRNASPNPVVWNGKTYEPQAELEGPDNGLFKASSLPAKAGIITIEDLPVGDYDIQEAVAPEGYICDPAWHGVSVKSGTNEFKLVLNDRVKREDITFKKLDANTNQPMPGVAFLLEKIALDDEGHEYVQEKHILVTDKNGIVNTSSYAPVSTSSGTGSVEWTKHDYKTNDSDQYYNEATGEMQEGAPLTGEHGYYVFCEATVANNDYGALPYGRYRLSEVRCDANKGYDLVKRDLIISRNDGLLEDLGTIDNNGYPPPPPEIKEETHGTKLYAHLSAKPDPIEAGAAAIVHATDTITYTVEYQNTSEKTIDFARIRVPVPNSTTFANVADGGVFNAEGNYVEWKVTDLAPGATGTVSYSVTVNKAPDSIIYEQARYAIESDDFEPGTNDMDFPLYRTNVVRHTTDGTKLGPNLTAKKSVSRAGGEALAYGEKVKVGERLRYTIEVKNEGDTAVENVGVADALPVGTKLAHSLDADHYSQADICPEGYEVVTDADMVGFTLGKMNPGDTKSVWFEVVVTDEAGFTVENQATFGPIRDKVFGPLDSSTNIVVVPIVTDPAVRVTKEASVEETVAGEIITFTLHVSNNGRGNAKNVNVYDIIPDHTQYVMGSISAPGNVQYEQDHSFPMTMDGQPTEEQPYVSWNIPLLWNDNESVDLTYQVRVKDDTAEGDLIRNRASIGKYVADVDSEQPDVLEDPENGVAVSNLIEIPVVDPLKDLEIHKSVNTDSEYVAAGDELTYTIEWKNNGSHSIYGFGVRDSIPEHTTFVDGSIVLIGADGRTSDEYMADLKGDVDPENPDECGIINDGTGTGNIIWVPYATLANNADPEGIYHAVVRDEATQHLYNWGSLKAAITHLNVGESVEFEVINDNDYDQLWQATLLADGRLALLMRVLVPNGFDSPNYTLADGAYANYDAKWKDVYALVSELKPGQTGSLTFTVKVDEDTPDNTEIVNFATYGQNVYDAPCFDLPNKTNEVVNIVGSPKLVGTKTVDKEVAKRGDKLHYTVTVTNEGTARAKDVAIRDQFRENNALKGLAYVPNSFKVSGSDAAEKSQSLLSHFDSSTNFVAAQASVLEPGDSIVMEFDVTIVDAFLGDVFKNVASFEDHHPDQPLDGDLDQFTNEVETRVEEPKLEIVKAADPKSGTEVSVGDTITYNFTVSNKGSVGASGVAVWDVIPNYTEYVAGSATGGLVPVVDEESGAVVALKASGISLAAGASKTFTFKVCIDPMLENDVIISNRATTGFSDDPTGPLELDSNETQHNAVAPDAALRVCKSSDPEPGTPVKPGDVITYTVKVKNDATVSAKGGALFDLIPLGTTYVNGSAGEIVKVPADPEAGTEETTRVDTSALRYVSSTDCAGRPAIVGDKLNFQPGEERIFTYKVTVDNTFEDGVISNRATVGFAENPTINLDVDSQEVIHPVNAPKPGLGVTASADPADGTKVAAGDVITYTINVSETEGVPVNGVAVFDYIPANTKYVEGSNDGGIEPMRNSAGVVTAMVADGIDLGAKGSKTMSFQVEVLPVSEDTTVTNRPTAGIAENPTLPLDHAAQQITHSVTAPKATLSVIESSSPVAGQPVGEGDTIDYSFTVSNTSSSIARGVAVFNVVPEHTQYVDGSATPGLSELRDDNGRVWALYADNLTLAANRSRSFGYAVTVVDDLTDGTAITNRTTTGFATAPKAPLEIDSNEVVHNSIAPRVSVSITSDPKDGQTVVPGDDISYTVHVTNATAAPDHNVGVFVPVPDGCVFVPDSITKPEGVTAKTIEQDGVVTGVSFLMPEVGGYANDQMGFKVRVTDGAPAKIENKATWDHTSTVPDGPLAQESNVVEAIVDHVPYLSIVKEQDPGNGAWVAGGDELTYTITVTNNGRATARKVGIYDEAPANTTYVEGSLSSSRGNVYVGEDGLLSALVGDLSAGESASMTFKVKIDLGFVGTIYNRAMWVSPAADPTTLPVNDQGGSSNPTDANAGNQPEGVTGTLVPVFGATVPIPDGSYSGVSNEVTAGGGDNPTTGGDPAPTNPDPTPTPDPTPDPTTNPDEGGQTPGEPGSNETEAGVKAPEVSLTKSAVSSDGSVVKAGSVITYTLRIENTGDVNANSLYIRDVLPAGLRYVADSAESNEANVAVSDGTLVGRVSLKPTESAVITFKASVQPGFSGDIVNYAEWGQAEEGQVPTKMLGRSNETRNSTDGGNPENGNSNEVNAHVSAPNLQVIKTGTPADGSIVEAGSTVSYKIAISNVGRVNANSLYVRDELPEGMTLKADSLKASEGLTATVDESGAIIIRGSMAPAATGEVTFDVTIAKDLTADLVNVARWGQAEDDKVPTDLPGKSNEVLYHVGTTDVEVIKSSDVLDGGYVAHGATINYKLVATNKGTIASGVVLDDLLPESVTYVADSATQGTVVTTDEGRTRLTLDVGEIAPGESATLEFAATVNADADGTIVNAGSWHLPGHDEEWQHTNSITHHVGDPNISVSKTSDPAGGSYVAKGSELSYTVKVTNSGLTSGIARLTDTLPDGLSLKADSVQVTTDIPEDAAAYAVADQVAAPAETGAEGSEQVDVSVKPDGPISRAFSDFVDFVTGKASDTAGIVVDGNVIKGAMSVKPGECVTVTYKATVVGEPGSEITNKAVVEVDGHDPVDSENKVIVGKPDIRMVKAADVEDGTTVKAGDVITYTMYAVNDGSVPAEGVVMYDTIPAGTTYVEGSASYDGQKTDDILTKDADGNVNGVSVMVGTLESQGKSASLSFQVKVSESASEVVTNTGHFDVDQPSKPVDPDRKPEQGGDSDKVDNPIDHGQPDPEKKEAKLSVTKIAIDGNEKQVSTSTGNDQFWKITVKNEGNADANGVRVSDVMGKGLEFTSATDTNGKAIAAEISGVSSHDTELANKARDVYGRSMTVSGYYDVSVPTSNNRYATGSGNSEANTSVCPVPAGDYDVRLTGVASQGLVSVKILDASGNTITFSDGKSEHTTSLGVNGLSTTDFARMTVPENCTISMDMSKSTSDGLVKVSSADGAVLALYPVSAYANNLYNGLSTAGKANADIIIEAINRNHWSESTLRKQCVEAGYKGHDKMSSEAFGEALVAVDIDWDECAYVRGMSYVAGDTFSGKTGSELNVAIKKQLVFEGFSDSSAQKAADLISGTMSNANSKSSTYHADMIVNVPAGKSTDIIVRTKITSDAGSEVTNKAEIFTTATSTDKLGESSATIKVQGKSNGGSSSSSGTNKPSGSLPQTGAAIATGLAIAAGLGIAGFGITTVVRNRKRSEDKSED